ncbi:MAG TPA: PAS domain S-box protein, partial [Anaerolineae bacterium]|nr:PAS domain S-box protein [Anaerolineae bacterium]
MKKVMDWFKSPVFAGDEEKTARARLLNAIGLQFVITLVLAAVVYVPFFVQQKRYSWLVILTLLGAWAISHHWALRGRLRLAGILTILVAWAIFFGMAWFSGGAIATVMLYIAATIVVGSLLLGARVGNLLAISSVLFGLVMAILHERGYEFPTVLTFSPLREWAVFAIGAGFIISTMNLVIHNLQETLAFARQENVARRQAEAALRASADRYRSMTEQMSDLVFTTDATGVITYLSAATPILFGCAPQAMVGRHFTEFLNPAAVDAALAAFTEMIAHGNEAPVLTLEMKRADGALFHGELKAQRFEDAGEVGALGIIRDVSDRVQAEAALRQNEQRLVFALKATNDGLWDWNLLTNVAYFSPQYYRMLGYEPDAFPANYENWRALVYPHDIEGCEGALQDAIAHGHDFDMEFRLRTQAGDWKWILGRGRVIETDLQGRPVRMVGTHVDITERKQAELEIRRRTEKLAALYAMSRRVSASLSLEHLILAALEEIFTAVRPDVAYFFVRDGERLLLQHIAPESARAKLEIPEHRVGECMCGLAVTYGRALYSRDIFADLRCTWAECKEAGFRSFAGLPLSNGAEILGVIGLATTYERDFESEAEFLETLVGEVAISFQNARLYEQLKARTVALESEIAERQHAEAALRESEERNRLITEMTTDYIFIVDVAPAGLLKLRWASESMTRMTGRTIAEAATSDLWASIIHPEDARSFFGFIQKMLTGALPGVIECRSFSKAGEERWIQINAYPRGDANGVVVSIVGAIKDITERKQAEEALRISLEKYRVLFETLPVGVAITDEHGQIVEANRASERILGLSRAEHSQRSITAPDWRIIRPDGAPMRVEDYASVRALQTCRQVDNVEMGVYRSDGSVVWLNVTAAPIPLAGYGVVIAYTDITARKEMEEHLRRQERLAAVGQLAAGIAHDFRNLLTTIILYAQLGLHKPDLPDGVAHGLETIVGESRKATELVQQILDFSSRGLIERRPLELGDFTRKVMTVLQRTIPETISITLNVQAGEFVVAADAGRL